MARRVAIRNRDGIKRTISSHCDFYQAIWWFVLETSTGFNTPSEGVGTARFLKSSGGREIVPFTLILWVIINP